MVAFCLQVYKAGPAIQRTDAVETKDVLVLTFSNKELPSQAPHSHAHPHLNLLAVSGCSICSMRPFDYTLSICMTVNEYGNQSGRTIAMRPAIRRNGIMHLVI